MICKYGISGSVSPQEIDSVLEREGDVRAVLVTNPNYYGICSDIEKIAETAHRHGALPGFGVLPGSTRLDGLRPHETDDRSEERV